MGRGVLNAPNALYLIAFILQLQSETLGDTRIVLPPNFPGERMQKSQKSRNNGIYKGSNLLTIFKWVRLFRHVGI